MTKKEKLFANYEKVKDKAVCVTLLIKMPTGETEVISNPNLEAKMAYIDKTYGDDLVHSGCKQICIENYAFECMDEPMDFGSALMNLKEGHKIARKGWNGKGMFLFLADNIDFDTPADLTCVQDLEGDLTCPSIVIKTEDNKLVVGWLASQTDMLAEDWVVLA